MKTIRLIFILVISALLIHPAIGQDSVQITGFPGQVLELNTYNTYGAIQWQDSLPGGQWSNIDGLTRQRANITVSDTERFVRARFTEGACNPMFSAITKITPLAGYGNDTASIPLRPVAHKIIWNDASTAKKLTQDNFGDYGRVRRLGNSDTLLLVYHGGPNTLDWLNIYMRISYDNGETWQDEKMIANHREYPDKYWRYCTPELLVMRNGWVMLAYEANARPDENKSEIHIKISKDSCRTWDGPIKYLTGRTWEPAMVQLHDGEIELFYSSENLWWDKRNESGSNVYQDIKVLRSTNNGLSWSLESRAAYYPLKRDGMPVPLVLQNNKGVVFAIETVNAGTSPYILWRPMNEPWTVTTSNFENNTYRWLATGFSGHGGAPYLLQLPTGETVLSAHIYRGGDWHQNNYMEVMVGDDEARNFGDVTRPWGTLPNNSGAVNNSLFLKNDTTIVTITCRMFPDGTGGLYWLEGSIVEK
ncbi:MAG: exo-alpha-sialidase [Bacteroidales bacterium]|nr:exo-alpha-sialidase [Bacteroidales bacterium]